ncbi:LysR family transcriptional regulator [Chromobacterium violaceum]|uniref:LysR family transcriptional regulator n=1 Tax=Chromobacterium violaceum TaxID=536 RepID=UPI0009DAE841|nr:LysR family transcriptional regulator [Chromobacterium violaceum]QRO32821.1 LysR family transcriptional regulator [Chromobacterium violaceum]QRQ17378.1 LysR family transcriptional regulator [Chromobacterium violaceum]
MKLTLEALQVLDAIEQHGSFAAAAEALFKVPSALTYTVQKLEQGLGVAIYDRSGHRARLTPAGERLLKDGRHLLDAARQLELRVSKQAQGWEDRLRIVVGDLVGFEQLLPSIADFDRLQSDTRLHFIRESFGGIWDALYDDRADLVIGAPNQPPPGDYFTRNIGDYDFVLVAAAGHPLAAEPEPVPPHVLRRYRAVAVGDTSRRLPARTGGLLEGQQVLTVHSSQAKLKAIVAGLGTGHLPRSHVRAHLDSGELVEKAEEESGSFPPMCFAWKQEQPGRAMQWFIQRLERAVEQGELYI